MAFSRQLAVDHGVEVRVNVLAPGSVRSPEEASFFTAILVADGGETPI